MKLSEIDTVVGFARARHSLWEGKHVKSHILANRKFTNVFRVLDRGSQYLLQLMNSHEDPLDRLALSYFYRQVNRPDTMNDIIARNKGYAPNASEILDPSWYDRVVAPVSQARPGAFLSGAYMILISPGDKGSTVQKMQAMFPAARPHLEQIAGSPSLASRVKALQLTPGLGPFMAMQIATDMGYCEGETDQENTFVLAGPGSRRGVGFLLGKEYATPAEAHHVITTFPFDALPPLPESNGRLASWMDVQNIFCEYSKYGRMVQRGDRGAPQPYTRHGTFPLHIPSHFVQ